MHFSAHFNLATALRAHGELVQAIGVLKNLLVISAGKVSLCDYQRYRQTLIHYYLRTGTTDKVAPLLSEAEDYVNDQPEDGVAKTNLTNDRAHYAYLRKELIAAAELAWQSARAEDAPKELRAEACLLLHQIAMDQGLQEQALAAAILAQQLADAAEREDLRREAASACRTLLALNPTLSGDLMADLMARKKARGG